MRRRRSRDSRGVEAEQASGSRSRSWRGAGPYPLRLEPVALPGDQVYLDGLGEVRPIERMLPFPEVQAYQDGVTVNANGTNSDNALEELEMPTGWLGQWRMMRPGEDLPDGISVSVDYGGEEAPMFNTNNTIGEFSNETGTVEGYDESAGASFASETVANHLLEWYVPAVGEVKRTPLFTFSNSTAGNLTVQNVAFSGYQFKLGEPLAEPEVDPEPIPLPVRAPDRE